MCILGFLLIYFKTVLNDLCLITVLLFNLLPTSTNLNLSVSNNAIGNIVALDLLVGVVA